MAKRLRVGNLPPLVGDAELIELFSAHGAVANAWVVLDRDTRQSRCFGFVDMQSEEEARAAITALDRKPLMGQILHVELLVEPSRPPAVGRGPHSGPGHRFGPPPGGQGRGFGFRGPGGPRPGPRGPGGFGRGGPPRRGGPGR